MNLPTEDNPFDESNEFSKTTSAPIDWKKIAMIAIVLGVVGYTWYTENFAKQKGGGTAVAEREQDQPFSKDDYKVTFDANNGKQKSDSELTFQFDEASANQNAKPKKPSGPYLIPAGGENLKSPAGLIYTGGREHRTDHVLRHAKDIPNRDGPHGVFHADGDDVFRLIDEAYELVKKKSKQARKTEQRDGKTAYVVDMKREIGFMGGKKGKRERHPKLYKVKLVLGDNRVITAYPF